MHFHSEIQLKWYYMVFYLLAHLETSWGALQSPHDVWYDLDVDHIQVIPDTVFVFLAHRLKFDHLPIPPWSIHLS